MPVKPSVKRLCGYASFFDDDRRWQHDAFFLPPSPGQADVIGKSRNRPTDWHCEDEAQRPERRFDKIHGGHNADDKAQNGGGHGIDHVAGAPKQAGGDAHEGEDKVKIAHDGDKSGAHFNNDGLLGLDKQQHKITAVAPHEQGGKNAEYRGDEKRAAIAFFHPVKLLGADILAREKGHGLAEVHDGHGGQTVDPHGGAIGSHGQLAEGVDKPLHCQKPHRHEPLLHR